MKETSVLEAAPTEEIRFPVYCYNCMRDREMCPNGESGHERSCAEVERESAEYQEIKEAGGYDIPFFNIRQLKATNEAGVTQQEMHRDVIESAKRDGREDHIQMKH